MLHAVAIKDMATQDQSTISGTSNVNRKKIQTIVSGMISAVDVLEHHNYSILDYPMKQVQLIHIELKDDHVNVFDLFMQASKSSVPVPGDICPEGLEQLVYGFLFECTDSRDCRTSQTL